MCKTCFTWQFGARYTSIWNLSTYYTSRGKPVLLVKQDYREKTTCFTCKKAFTLDIIYISNYKIQATGCRRGDP